MKLSSHFKRLLCIGLLATAAQAIAPTTIADVSGNGTASAVGTAPSGATPGQLAHWITIQAAPTNSVTACSTATYTGCPRVGDANISTTQGIYLLPSTTLTFPADDNVIPQYQLWTIYYLVQSGDKITITYSK